MTKEQLDKIEKVITLTNSLDGLTPKEESERIGGVVSEVEKLVAELKKELGG